MLLDPNVQNVTLTPLHLRKAKLMFFYVRYPSSVLLKNYFCDVHFNKNNTAQLVKWFSNFRYGISMEVVRPSELWCLEMKLVMNFALC